MSNATKPATELYKDFAAGTLVRFEKDEELQFEVLSVTRDPDYDEEYPDGHDYVTVELKSTVTGSRYALDPETPHDVVTGEKYKRTLGPLVRDDRGRFPPSHVRRDREKRIEAQAVKDLEHHVLTVKEETPAFRWYRFARPGTIHYSFDVIFFPGSMLVQGDMGEFWWQRTYDMEGWARSSIRDISYFSEKVIREIDTEEFSSEAAEELLREEYAQHVERLVFEEHAPADAVAEQQETFERLHGAANEDREGHAFYTAYYESDWYGGDLPCVKQYRHHFLWVREGVKQVFKALDARERMLAHAEQARFD